MFGKKKAEVLVVGAGPVGMMAALLLKKNGVHPQIIDRFARTNVHSYALALHSKSLSLLNQVGILDPILNASQILSAVSFYAGTEQKAAFDLSKLSAEYPYIAVVPQEQLESQLERALEREGIPVMWNHRLAELDNEHEDCVAVRIERLAEHMTGYAVARMDWFVEKNIHLEVPFVLAADGEHSFARRHMGIDFERFGSNRHFAIFEYATQNVPHKEVRIMVDGYKQHAYWPMPEKVRWIFELDADARKSVTANEDPQLPQFGSNGFPVLNADSLHRLLAKHAPWFNETVGEIDWRIGVDFSKRLATTSGKNRVWLLGDAAHTTLPFGVQSMNVGLLEAKRLTSELVGILRDDTSIERLNFSAEEHRAAWPFLLGETADLHMGHEVQPWVKDNIAQLLPCIPASGSDLEQLLQQLGVQVKHAYA